MALRLPATTYGVRTYVRTLGHVYDNVASLPLDRAGLLSVDATRSCNFCSVGTLSGPAPIARNGQVTVPKGILGALGWRPGEFVMFRLSDDDPEVLTILPVAVVERRYQRGEDAERMMRMTSLEQTRDEQHER